MFQKLKQTIAYVTGLLGIAQIPIEEGKVNFTDDQRAKVEESLGAELTAQMIAVIEKEVSAVTKASEEDLEAAKQELLAVMTEAGYTDEEKETIINAKTAEDLNLNAQFKQLNDKYLEIKAQMEKQKQTIEALIKDPEPDDTKIINMAKNHKFNHNATHLFASGQSYDAFEDRPWNQRFRDGGKATDFSSDVEAPVLKGDIQNFIRTNPGVIKSLFNDLDQLPAEWNHVVGVEDMYTSASVLPSEVMQGRSKGWNPKGKIKIDAELGKVYAKKIDIEFDGQQLQKLETTWIAAVHNLNGSHPYKMHFIYWVIDMLVQKAAADERKAMINGIYVPTPDGDTVGKAIDSQNGLLWNFYYYRDVVKKYKPFQLGEPTELNYDQYIKNMIEMLPEKERNEEGWEIIHSPKLQMWYQDLAGDKYVHNYTPDQGKKKYSLNHPIDYPNFKFRPLVDHNNSLFVAIVKSNNINKLDFKPEEKKMLTMGQIRRDTYFFADYKSGIGLGFVGMKDNNADFTKQLVYSNDVPVFPENKTIMPYAETGNTILKVNYNKVQLPADWNENITDIQALDDLPFSFDLKGQLITIIGDTSIAAGKKIENSGKFTLTADFAFNTGGSLTLYCKSDGTFTEISRTSTPVAPDTGAIEFTDEDVIDAGGANEFHYVGLATATDTLSTILNGVEGKEITIIKTLNNNGALTIQTTDNISVISAAVLDAKDESITLVKHGDTWYEIARNIS